MKKILLVIAFLFVLSVYCVHADNVFVTVRAIEDRVEADQTAHFQLEVQNNQAVRDVYMISYDSLSVFPFSDFANLISIDPQQVKLDPGENATIDVKIQVLNTVLPKKRYETTIKVASLLYPTEKVDASLLTYVVSPKEAIQIFPEIPHEVIPGVKTNVKITLKNVANIGIDQADIAVTSDMPGLKQDFSDSLPAKSERVEEFTFVPDVKVKPGDYTLTVKVFEHDEVRGFYTTAFSVVENPRVEQKEATSRGFLTSVTTITKTNGGNAASKETIAVPLSFVRQLFTTVSPVPTAHDGVYTWEFTLQPDQVYTVQVLSNYRAILYGLLVIILAVFVLLWHVKQSVILKKRIFKLKETPEGIYELKILLYLRNGKRYPLTATRMIDLLPLLMVATNEYGTLKPTKVQQGEKGTRLIWELGTINPGEERVLSYKVKTKLQLTGEALLPAALVQFVSRSNKVVHVQSGRLEIKKTETEEE